MNAVELLYSEALLLLLLTLSLTDRWFERHVAKSEGWIWRPTVTPRQDQTTAHFDDQIRYDWQVVWLSLTRSVIHCFFCFFLFAFVFVFAVCFCLITRSVAWCLLTTRFGLRDLLAGWYSSWGLFSFFQSAPTLLSNGLGYWDWCDQFHPFTQHMCPLRVPHRLPFQKQMIYMICCKWPLLIRCKCHIRNLFTSLRPILWIIMESLDLTRWAFESRVKLMDGVLREVLSFWPTKCFPVEVVKELDPLNFSDELLARPDGWKNLSIEAIWCHSVFRWFGHEGYARGVLRWLVNRGCIWSFSHGGFWWEGGAHWMLLCLSPSVWSPLISV